MQKNNPSRVENLNKLVNKYNEAVDINNANMGVDKSFMENIKFLYKLIWCGLDCINIIITILKEDGSGLH